MRGWRAADPGTQTIRLIFDQPQRLGRISLVFEENEIKRTQEFVLRWSPDGGRSFRDIVRQQWNFSPPDTVHEVEEYQVELSDVTALELIIVPNNSGGAARASLLCGGGRERSGIRKAAWEPRIYSDRELCQTMPGEIPGAPRTAP